MLNSAGKLCVRSSFRTYSLLAANTNALARIALVGKTQNEAVPAIENRM